MSEDINGWGDEDFLNDEMQERIRANERRKREEAQVEDVEIIEVMPHDSKSGGLAIIAGDKPDDVGRILKDAEGSPNLKESITAIESSYKRLGEQYNLNIRYDISSVAATFNSIYDDKSLEILKLYQAKTFETFRISMIQSLMGSIMALVERISKDIETSTDPIFCVATVEKLFLYMEKVNELYKDIHVDSADLRLKRLADEYMGTSNATSGGESLDEGDVGMMGTQITKLLRGKSLK